jgi:hypothetical protein
MPLSMPFSQRSHQRMCSGIRSWFGPGSDVSVPAWAHGPNTSRFGHVSRSNVRNELLRYPSAQPATIIVGHSIAS